ncbi:unnamed protein product [Prorocentrum cordatum]|uniref:Calmodulin n=1 Tax=Prorocentrum cordatum TaxID=2364126 RepID=A0ABN9QEL3_9DINO|nr:unnamed protein product [Polarella glacialis]
MAGPWLGVDYDVDYLASASWSAGDVVEADGFDFNGAVQGKIISVVIGSEPRPREYEASLAGVQDDFYSWWAFESGEAEDPGLFKMTLHKREKAKEVAGRYITAVPRWRFLGSGGVPDLAPAAWLRRGLQKIVEERIATAIARAKASASPLPARRAGDGGDGAFRPQLLHGDRQEGHEVEEGRGGKGVADELEELKRDQMENRVGRDGEAGSWAKDDMPAAAKSYYIRVLRVAHASGGLRSLREMATLCHILDHVAKKRYKAAADVAGQRLNAVETAIVDGSWDRAQFLELVEQEDPLLAEQSERHMSSQELAFKQRNYQEEHYIYEDGQESEDTKEEYQEKDYVYEDGQETEEVKEGNQEKDYVHEDSLEEEAFKEKDYFYGDCQTMEDIVDEKDEVYECDHAARKLKDGGLDVDAVPCMVERRSRVEALRAAFSARFRDASDLASWQTTMRSCTASCTAVADLGLIFRAAAESSPSRIAAVAALVRSGTRDFGVEPGARGRGLLPISPEAAEVRFRRLAAEKGLEEATVFVDWGVAIVLVLNFFNCAGWCRRPVCTRAASALSAAQEKTLSHIGEGLAYVLEDMAKPLSMHQVSEDLVSRKSDYGGDAVSKRRDLECDLVVPVWPAAEHAGVLPIENFVFGEVREDFLDVKRCLLPASEWPETAARSRVHASDEEWYRIVQVGLQRGIFEAVAEQDILRDARGELVLNGAMGVDKWKVVNGVRTRFLRFITILDIWIDSEDMESCFNLFRMPPCWLGVFTFAKQVPRSVVGGPATEFMYVGVRTVPMDWIGAVDVMQPMARALVFKTCEFDPEAELHKERALPPGPEFAVVCMGGVDHLRKASAVLRRAGGPGESAGHHRFVEACANLNLPLNAGKSVVGSAHGALLGGEVDGIRGWLSHSRDKSGLLIAKALALLGVPVWHGGALQHWIGCFCCGASFRRPLFAVLQDVFSFAAAVEHGAKAPEAARADEVLAAAILAPLMYTNLRAPIRAAISCSDASEAGGGAAEATTFVRSLGRDFGCDAEALVARRAEESAWAREDAGEERCVMGCRLRAVVSKSTRGALAALRSIEAQLRNGRVGSFMHPVDSLVWHLPLVRALLSFPRVYLGSVRGDASVDLRIMHCSPELHASIRARGFDPQVGWRELLATAVRDDLARAESGAIPAAPSLRETWVRFALSSSTARLRRISGLSDAAAAISKQLASIQQGDELAHLRSLLRQADYKGSDVRLVTGELVDGCRQELPYPAIAWDWRTVQAYPWQQHHHINVLEVVAYLTYLRLLSESALFHGVRYFHIFDSKVVACVVAKGRSSSRVLNRVCRRQLALTLATDTYVLTLWTISQWNFADAASRLHLDAEAAEYINHMYQEDEPHGYAITFVSALKRLYPKCRKRLDIASLYCKSWTRTVHRRRALPLPANVVVGMAGLAFAFGEDRVGISFLIGFLGLLRTGELLSLTVGRIKIASPHVCVIALPGSKGSHQKGFDESALIHDPVAIALLRKVVEQLPADERLFPGSFRDLGKVIRQYAVDSVGATPYCLRRGGAAWHFSKCASMDATQALGRWEQASTAKGYVNQAVSDLPSRWTQGFSQGVRSCVLHTICTAPECAVWAVGRSPCCSRGELSPRLSGRPSGVNDLRSTRAETVVPPSRAPPEAGAAGAAGAPAQGPGAGPSKRARAPPPASEGAGAPAPAPPAPRRRKAPPDASRTGELCREALRWRSTTVGGRKVDGRLHEGNFRWFVAQLLDKSDRIHIHWEVVWQSAGIQGLPEEERRFAAAELVRTLHTLTAVIGPNRTACAADALGDLIVLGLAHAAAVEVSLRGSVIADLDARPESRELLIRLLSRCFPRPQGTCLGVRSPSWDWQQWWSFVTRVLVGPAAARRRPALLAAVLRLLREEAGEAGLADGDGADPLLQLERAVETARADARFCGPGPAGPEVRPDLPDVAPPPPAELPGRGTLPGARGQPQSSLHPALPPRETWDARRPSAWAGVPSVVDVDSPSPLLLSESSDDAG